MCVIRLPRIRMNPPIQYEDVTETAHDLPYFAELLSHIVEAKMGTTAGWVYYANTS